MHTIICSFVCVKVVCVQLQWPCCSYVSLAETGWVMLNDTWQERDRLGKEQLVTSTAPSESIITVRRAASVRSNGLSVRLQLASAPACAFTSIMHSKQSMHHCLLCHPLWRWFFIARNIDSKVVCIELVSKAAGNLLWAAFYVRSLPLKEVSCVWGELGVISEKCSLPLECKQTF